MRLLALTLALVACGRLGFDARPSGRADAAGDAAPDAAVQGFTAIDVGGEFSCGIFRTRAYCWGRDAEGELGDGGSASSAMPVPVALPDVDVLQLSSGNTHSCAVLADGTARCWGAAMLGDGVTTQSATPVVVAGLPAPVTQVSAGYDFTCAIAAGDAYCWGDDSSERLGNGSAKGSSPVPGLTLAGPIAQVFAGGDHACAVRASGTAWCWGHNDGPGALGIGSDTPSVSAVPVQVVMLTQATAVTIAGYHACAIDAGAAWCWGTGTDGELGDGRAQTSNVPVAVQGMSSGVTAIHTGGGPTTPDTACAVRDGALACWGSGLDGRTGTGDTNDHDVPAAVALPAPVSAIAVGWYHACAIAAGDAWCWGLGTSGQLGPAAPASSYTPVRVPRP